MTNPYQAPGESPGIASERRTSLEWYAWLALNAVWGLLATFALAFSAWLLIVLTGVGRGLLY